MYMQRRNIDDLRADFLPLIIELECGSHYDSTNTQHEAWLKNRLATLFMSGGTAICRYDEGNVPVGLVLVQHDKGLAGVACFGKKATIAMIGILPAFRSKGLGKELLLEAERHAKAEGAECVYVDTYANNQGAIRFYVQQGYVPVAYHPYENGADDKGQVYLCKELT
ncbi:MAG: hypothetical protein RLZZ324_436 [Candidatus Parcubacteria bacterium]|jgi:ribosomal protein S18 acetylase RimI-like enzyme